MNIFYLDETPKFAAKDHCNKHVIKMILESAQLLCSALPASIAKYKHTHFNHPCAKWARSSKENFLWLVKLAYELGEEYKAVYHKTHKSIEVVKDCEDKLSQISFQSQYFTSPPKCMPDQYKTSSVIESYRSYYRGDKAKFASWEGRTVPDWW